MSAEEPPEPQPWELRARWVVITAVALWLLGAAGLLTYLFGPRVLS